MAPSSLASSLAPGMAASAGGVRRRLPPPPHSQHPTARRSSSRVLGPVRWRCDCTERGVCGAARRASECPPPPPAPSQMRRQPSLATPSTASRARAPVALRDGTPAPNPHHRPPNARPLTPPSFAPLGAATTVQSPAGGPTRVSQTRPARAAAAGAGGGGRPLCIHQASVGGGMGPERA